MEYEIDNQEFINSNEEFENSVSLWNICQSNEVKMLQTIVDHFHLQKSNKQNLPYPAIMLTGRSNTGRRCLAKAIHNSFGNLHWKEIDGSILNYGHDVSDFFIESDIHTTIYISNADGMNTYCSDILTNIIRSNRFPVVNNFKRKTAYIEYESRLIVLGSVNSNVVTLNAFAKLITSKINLPHKRKQEEIIQILRKRCDFLRIEYEEQLLKDISQVSSVVGHAVEILGFVEAVAQGERIGSKHFNAGIRMLSKNYENLKEEEY